MADTIGWSQCTLNFYKYKFHNPKMPDLKNTWIPIVVVDIPLSNWSGTLQFTGGITSLQFYPSQALVSLDNYPIPFWFMTHEITVYDFDSKFDYDKYFFVEYDEDKSKTNPDGSGSLRYNYGLKKSNGDILETNYSDISIDFSPKNRESYGMFNLVVFRDINGTILQASKFALSVSYNTLSLYKDNSQIGDIPLGNVRKGTFENGSFAPFGYSGASGINYAAASSEKTAIIKDIIKDLKPINPNNPYDNVGDEPDEPGQGDFDYSSDDVPIPDLPETDVTESGLVSLFAPNDDQLQRLAKFLWSDTFSLDSFKKILNNPMDCILGLSKLPVHLPHGSSKEITVGNVVSTVSCDTCKQYLKLNCGTFTFSRSRFTGGYLDNAPYTRCYLYLPFIGTQEINIDEFMGATMGIEYHIDVLTGAMFCFVTRNSKLLLTYAGNCAENIPLSSNDFTSTISSMLSMATVGAGAVATIATAGAAAPTTAGMASEALGARTASSLVGAGAQGANAVMNSKPNVSHSGSLGGGAGAMGQLYPYLIFIAPRPDIPTDQNMYTGFPSNDIVQIGNLKDFNVIEAVNLKVEGANDTEMSEIEAILKGGVII